MLICKNIKNMWKHVDRLFESSFVADYFNTEFNTNLFFDCFDY